MNSKPEITQAVVLVGGFGTRLRPLTLERPKQMLPIAHKPMIEVVLAQLYQAGITSAVLAMGYKPDVFLEAYPDGVCAGVKLEYAVEPDPLDTAGAIKFAIDETNNKKETFLAVNGDVICDANLTELFYAHFQNPGLATLLSKSVDDPSQFGVVVTDEDSRVLEFHEKPDPKDGYGNNINAGMYVLDAAVLDLISAGKPVSIEKEVFPELVKRGELFTHLFDGYWIDAGTPEAYLQAQLDIAERLGEDIISPTALVDKSAIVEASLLGEGVEIMGGAQIYGSAILDGARVEANAIVKQSILGYGAHIGESAELQNLCIVGEGEKIAPNAQLKAYRG